MDCVELIAHSAEDMSCFPPASPADEEDWGFWFHKDREFLVNAALDLAEELKGLREEVTPTS